MYNSLSINFHNRKHSAKHASCVLRTRATVLSVTQRDRHIQQDRHTQRDRHTQKPSGFIELIFGNRVPRNLLLLSSLGLFLQFGYLSHSLSRCALHPCWEPRIILESLNAHILPIPECQTGQSAFLLFAWPAHLSTSLESICSGHHGANGPQHQRSLETIPRDSLITM